MNNIAINELSCTGCGICVDVCPYGIFSSADDTVSVDLSRASLCSECGHCFAFCPEGAVLVSYPGSSGHEGRSGTGIDILRETMKSRRSVRNYADNPVPQEMLHEIFDMVRYAPSGMNRQTVNWTVIQDPAEVRRIAELTIIWARDICSSSPEHPFAPVMPMLIGMWDRGIDLVCQGAPHLVIAHGEKDDPSAFLDSVIAMAHFDLAACACGLGTCWAGLVQMAADSSPDFHAEMGLPPGHRSHYVMMLGYPKYSIRRIPRRKLAKVTWR